jgi:hypothetical protein
MTKPVPTGDSDPTRDQLLKLLADLNAQSKAVGGMGFGFFMDGKGNTYFQSSTDLDAPDHPELPEA